MKRILFLFSISIFLISCGNSPKSQSVSTKDTIARNIVPVNKGEEDHWIGKRPDAPVADSVHIIKSGSLSSNKDKTPEEKKKDLEMRQARTHFKNGVELYNKGQKNEALEEFKETLTYDPQNSLANYNLGKIYYETGQKELSLSYYKDAVKYNPKDSNSIVAIGLIYFENQKFDLALDYFNEGIEIAPKYGLAYYNRGTMLGQQKHYDKALSDLNLAAKYDPNNSKVFMNRGMVHFFLKDMDEACKDWNKSADMGNSEGKKAVSIYCNKKSR